LQVTGHDMDHDGDVGKAGHEQKADGNKVIFLLYYDMLTQVI
jgi:hypothetical protein